MPDFNGLGMGLGNLSKVSNAETRSISAENFTGEKGKGGMATDGTGAHAARGLGQGWKVSPSVVIPGKTTFTLADIEGPGAIQHIWMTTHKKNWRKLVFRGYWDDEQDASIQVPYGDFFSNGWCEYAHVNSMPVAANPEGGFNCYWEMPFRRSAKLTLENLGDEPVVLYFQITYTLTEIPEDAAYFHAYWNRNNPLPYKEVHTIADHIKGQGHYVGTYIAWGVNNNGWWGEGEIKFFMDGDREFPTICGTGTEDYFGGAWNFEYPKGANGRYSEFSTAFLGLPQVIRPDGLYRSQQRFGMYRWHIMDPIRFKQDLRVTIQALGWRNHEPSGGRYLPLQDDISSLAYWYQVEPHMPHPPMPEADFLEVI
ncbi:glycoside hydrolase family 172 protein [Paenibacillus allorhizosphaerae]|uniref:DUF2961 domain-containing protein n=1 Tax=Paenibacillus allorhizosphaerae TaxID=2849866 RepID=A0ABM8VE43_9BACL|nr:glycoside hydrolase family 172 protein [Paenibacillus allorhizosphaerae]CAG7629970.1 hypothetical protein PAECIP111802_01606 [Paenibacillus allorhizosphaerae]